MTENPNMLRLGLVCLALLCRFALAQTPGGKAVEPLHSVDASPFSTATNAMRITSPSHVLVVGDFVEIKVYQEDDLTTRARIDTDGTVTMPLLGQVKLAGLGVEAAQKTVRDFLFKDYLTNPQVTLTVVEPAKRRFCVLGEVRQPGFYLIPESEMLTVPQAVSMAGGLTQYGSASRVTIKRVATGRETVIAVNLGAMARKQKTELVNVEPGDTIVVASRIW